MFELLEERAKSHWSRVVIISFFLGKSGVLCIPWILIILRCCALVYCSFTLSVSHECAWYGKRVVLLVSFQRYSQLLELNVSTRIHERATAKRDTNTSGTVIGQWITAPQYKGENQWWNEWCGEFLNCSRRVALHCREFGWRRSRGAIRITIITKNLLRPLGRRHTVCAC